MLKEIATRYLENAELWEQASKVARMVIEEYESEGEELPVLYKAYKRLDEFPDDLKAAIKVAIILKELYGTSRIETHGGMVEVEVEEVPDLDLLYCENNKLVVNYTEFARFIAMKYAVVYFNGVFYVWDGNRYVDYDNVIDAVIYRHLLKCGFPETKRATLYVSEIRKQLQYLCSVREYPFNRHNSRILIPVKNCVLWWDDGEVKILPNSPVFGFTYSLNVNYVPNQKHDRIKAFLESLVNPEDLEILYEIPAACLVRTRFPYVYFLYGTGSNGKSTYLNLITDLLGEENVSNVSLHDLSDHSSRFRAAALIGKLANIFPDLPSTALKDTGIFKALTGDDRITVEKKFKDPFSFRNTARLIFSANTFPRVKDDSPAFWRRWILVKFPNKFENNPGLLESLTTDEEKSAFLDEILKRLPRILECNPTVNVDARTEWIRTSDSVTAFLQDCVVEDKDSYVIKEDLYNAYVEYCNEMGYEAVSQNAFSRRISSRYPTIRPRSNGRKRAYKGIRLKTEEEQKKEEEETNYVKIKLIKLPIGTDKVEFVGVDGKTYELHLDEVAEVPEENARPILERGYAIRC